MRDKASEMSGLDLITNTFKIMKHGYKKPMDLKAEVEKRLKASGRFLDENYNAYVLGALHDKQITCVTSCLPFIHNDEIVENESKRALSHT